MNQDVIKKMLVGLIIIIAFAIGVTLVISAFKKDDAPQPVAQEVKSPIKQKTEVPTDKLPDKFPPTLPVEQGAVISQNYNATANNGQYQATRAFETKQTLAANYTLYTNWLKNNGWKINSNLDGPSYKMVSGSKEKQQLQVSISENTVTKTNSVTLTLTIFP